MKNLNAVIKYEGIKLIASDVLFDYLMGDMPEYKAYLDALSLDTDPTNWTRYTTCYHIHFRHIRGLVL